MLTLPFTRPDPLTPPTELAGLRAETPICRVLATTGEPAWLVTRYADAKLVLSDRRCTLAMPGVEGGGPANDSIFQDPPGHTRLRRLVTAAFTPRRVAELRTRAAEAATARVAELASTEPPVDLMAALAFPVPITVIGELLGVPEDEREGFREWSDALMSIDKAADPVTGWQNLARQAGELIATKRANPADDLLSELITVRDNDNSSLSEPELVMMAITLIMAGYVTTSMATGIGAILLAGHLPELAADPTLVPTAVEEVLRYQAAGGDVARVAAADLELAGQKIKSGDKLIVSVVSANRDETRFINPNQFDITRTDNQHLTFGHGIHHCLGAVLARMQLQEIFTALARQLPNLSLTTDPAALKWQRSELFGDEWPAEVPVAW